MVIRARRAGRRRGVVAALLALSMTLLLGVVALTADGGELLAERRHAQATADAAARAAAADLFAHWASLQGTAQQGTDPNGTAKASAVKVAGDNGYTNVTVNIPPASGPSAGKPGCAEVIVQYDVPRAFSAVFGSGDLSVQARSVAQASWVFAPPVWVGDLSADLAFWQGNGGGNVNIGQTPTATNPYGGRVVVNSNAPDGTVNGATPGTINAYEYYIGSAAPVGSFNGTVHANQNPTPDPLGFISNPPVPPGAPGSVQFTTGSQTLNPGVYSTISVGSPLVPSGANLTLNPGFYYIQPGGKFQFLSNGTLRGQGVMIYSPQITISGTGNVTLSPLTSGDYTGLTLFQYRSSPNQLKIVHLGTPDDGNTYYITGAIYALNANIWVQQRPNNSNGTPGDLSIGSQFICRTLQLNGSGDINIPGNYVYQRIVTGIE